MEGSASVLEVYTDIGNRRKIEPIFNDYDFSYAQLNDDGYKKRRQAKAAKLKKKEAHGSQTKKITRVSKNVSVKRH